MIEDWRAFLCGAVFLEVGYWYIPVPAKRINLSSHPFFFILIIKYGSLNHQDCDINILVFLTNATFADSQLSVHAAVPNGVVMVVSSLSHV